MSMSIVALCTCWCDHGGEISELDAFYIMFVKLVNFTIMTLPITFRRNKPIKHTNKVT